MELTPLDIRNQTFHKKSFGGIDAEEVKAFLETAATAFEQLSRNRTDLNERLKIAEERVNYYRQIEKTIQDAVITMQRTVDEVKATAEKEAEIIIAEAKARAVREVESTKKQAEDLRAEIEQLKQLRSNYFIRCRSLIRGQEELLAAMENDQREFDAPATANPPPQGRGEGAARRGRRERGHLRTARRALQGAQARRESRPRLHEQQESRRNRRDISRPLPHHSIYGKAPG